MPYFAWSYSSHIIIAQTQQFYAYRLMQEAWRRGRILSKGCLKRNSLKSKNLFGFGWRERNSKGFSTSLEGTDCNKYFGDLCLGKGWDQKYNAVKLPLEFKEATGCSKFGGLNVYNIKLKNYTKNGKNVSSRINWKRWRKRHSSKDLVHKM